MLARVCVFFVATQTEQSTHTFQRTSYAHLAIVSPTERAANRPKEDPQRCNGTTQVAIPTLDWTRVVHHRKDKTASSGSLLSTSIYVRALFYDTINNNNVHVQPKSNEQEHFYYYHLIHHYPSSTIIYIISDMTRERRKTQKTQCTKRKTTQSKVNLAS